MKNILPTDTDAHSSQGRLMGGSRGEVKEASGKTLRRLCDYGQRNLSLNAQRTFLLVFILLQALLFTGYLTYQYTRIEEDAARTLRNTALLEAQQFETSMDAMRYQLRFIGNAILLNHTVALKNAESFLEHEEKKDWLDAVIVVNAQGDFVAKSSLFPIEQALMESTLARASFRDRPLYRDMRRADVNERLFHWQGNGDAPNFTGFVMYRAVRDPEGRYLGGVVGYVNQVTMAALFQKMERRGFDLGPGGSMTILDHDTGLELARSGSGAGAVLSAIPALNLMSYAGTSAEAHHYVSPIDGKSRLGVLLQINDNKWVLSVSLAERDILGVWYIQAIGVTLAVLAMAILQWLLLHYVRANFLQRERFAQEARRDPLTNLANRRYFDKQSRRVCSLARRYQQSLCVLSFDLDFFKKINDSYGHDGGDAVLKHVARALGGLLRESDIAARFGGEEFVVALPHTDLDMAREVAERIRASFAAHEVEFKGQMIRFTASFGIAQMTADELDVSGGIHAALSRADLALYRSKQEGRNRVSTAPA